MTISDSFVRSFDDSIVLKGVNWGHGSREEMYSERPMRNIRASNLVVWCDWGRALEIGAETLRPEFADVVFRDIDIIRSNHIAIDIQHGDRAAMHDIRFENIRVEVDDFNPLPLIQKQPGEKYNPTPDAPAGACAGCATRPAGTPYVPNLLVFVIVPEPPIARSATRHGPGCDLQRYLGDGEADNALVLCRASMPSTTCGE